MSVVKRFGAVTAVLIGNARKAMTILLSFLLFPKPFSDAYAIGGTLVLGGLVVNVYLRHSLQQKSRGKLGAASSAAAVSKQHSHAASNGTPGVAILKQKNSAHNLHHLHKSGDLK